MTRNSNQKVAIVITAAGSSTRMGTAIKKEYLPLNDGTVLSNCAGVFLNADYGIYELSDFIITVPKDGEADARKAMESIHSEIQINYIEGSSTRQSSVFNALKALYKNEKNLPDIVLIHDGARPFVTKEVVESVFAAAVDYGASVPGVTPVDTQKEIDENGFIVRHLVRKNLSAVQTPQGFHYKKLYEAHTKAADDEYEYTDDTEIWGAYCGAVKVVPGDVKNIKITYPKDLEVK